MDWCASQATRDNQRNEARLQYLQRASSKTLELPSWLRLEPDFATLPDRSWLAFEIAFTLERPWYSKDDRPFHVLDNPLHKDRVFGVPYMAAASWKGLLRWACRMQAGLHDHLAQHGGTLDRWQDPPWILHLFGNEKEEKESFQRGALAFYPTWLSKIGFEVINPHSRKTRAGTQPIYYEVVSAGAKGTLRLLYAPLPSAADRDKVKPNEAFVSFLDATECLLTTYGISAKRTAGWGTARVDGWKAWRNGQPPIADQSLTSFKEKLQPWLDEGDRQHG